MSHATKLRQDVPPDGCWSDVKDMRRAVRHWSKRIGVPVNRLQIRPMPRKWASVSTAGQLTLNAELLSLPRELGEFVIVHELVHLLAPNHGRMHTSFMQAYLTDWRERQAALARHSGTLP